MKKILWFLLGSFFFAGVALAAPYYTAQRSLVPVDSTENVGTSTARWAEGWFTDINISGTCTGCGGTHDEWSHTTNFGVTTSATTSPVWFQGSPYSIFASSTAEFDNSTTTLSTIGTLWITGFTAGAPYFDSNGKLFNHATTSSSVASQDVWRDGNGNTFSNNFIPSLTTTVSAGGTTTLNPASTRYQMVTGTATQTFRLPIANASGMATGATFEFNNNSTLPITVQNQAGTSVITVPSNGYAKVVLSDASTPNGVWENHALISHNSIWGDNGVGIATSTPYFQLTVSSSTAPQISLTDTSLTANPWDFRSINGNFYLSTSSPITFATSTTPSLTILDGAIAGKFGVASSTPWKQFSIGTGNVGTFAISTSTDGCAQFKKGEVYSTGTNCTTGTVTSIDVSGGTTGLTFSGGPVTTSGTITMAGTLGIANGGTGTTTTASGWLTYWGSSTQRAVATSSASCSGFITCSGFTVVGSVSPTITTTGQLAIASGGTNSSSFTTNSIMWFNGTSIVSTSTEPLYVGSIIATSTIKNSGIGTSTPWGSFGIHAASQTFPFFNIGSSTNSVFTINQYGGVELTASQPATTTTLTMDWSKTSHQVEYRIGTSATTLNIINATTSEFWGSSKIIWVCNPGTTAGALTITGVEWIGTAPTQTTAANQCDIYSFNITRATSTSAYKVAGTAGTAFQ